MFLHKTIRKYCTALKITNLILCLQSQTFSFFYISSRTRNKQNHSTNSITTETLTIHKDVRPTFHCISTPKSYQVELTVYVTFNCAMVFKKMQKLSYEACRSKVANGTTTE